MEALRRTRGRPKGVSVKPYVKRTPKVVGFAETKEEDLTPVERLRVRMFTLQYDQDRQSLCQQARVGNHGATMTLWERFHLFFPVISPSSMAGVRI